MHTARASMNIPERFVSESHNFAKWEYSMVPPVRLI